METTIVQPGASPSIYTTGDRNHGHHDGHQLAEFIALAGDIRNSTSVTGDRINTGVQVTGDRVTAVGSAAALASGRTNELVQAAACRTDSLVQAGFGDTSDRICASTKDVTAALGTGFTAAALAACKTADEVAAVYASLQKQVSDAATATVVGFKDAQATAYQIEGRTQLDAAKNAAALGLQATTNANALSVEATKNAYQLSLEAVKNAAAAQLEAQKNAASISKELAECCCELRTQAAANLAAITATVVAGNTAILGKMDQTTICLLYTSP